MANEKKSKTTNSQSEDVRRGLVFMTATALVVGAVAGFGAVVFRGMIGFFHNLLFLGSFSFSYSANVHTPPSPWGPLVILVPVVGAVGVVFLVKTFAPEARGHGVPEVMDAVYYMQGRIRPIVAVIKSLASAISIGTGGSVGREGPIIQIGAAFGSTIGQWVPMRENQRVTLIAAGAAGGIAATFNTPIGGLVFAIELLLPAINATTLLPVAVATVTATYISRFMLGEQPAFIIPPSHMPSVHQLNPAAYPLFALFGLLVGLLATLFVRSIYWSEDQFEKLPGNYYTRHMLGMLAVGVLMYSLLATTGKYYVEGVGYAMVEDVLEGSLTAPLFLLLLVAAKLLATNLTLGSGASGGVFSPCLFMGAALGGCFGLLAERLIPGLHVQPGTFAVVGMAAMIAGSTGAIVTAIAMLFEMTRDYNAILPVVLTVVFAYIVRKRLSKASIYTLKLLRRGHVVPEGLQASLDSAREASHVMTRDFVVKPSPESGEGESGNAANENTAGEGAASESAAGRAVVHSTDHKLALRWHGHTLFVSREQINASGGESAGSESAGSDAEQPHEASRYVVVGEHDSLHQVLSALESAKAEIAIVSRRPESDDVDDIVGVITSRQVFAALGSSADLFRD